MRHTKEAFDWIVDLLRKHKIKFQVSGGFAARLYGSKRKLADIDIDVSEKFFKHILPEIKEYIKFGPAHYRDKKWNLKLVTLNYKRQLIDLGASKQKIYDKMHHHWDLLKTHFSKSKELYAYDLRVPVISKEELIKYKSELARKVDKEDIKQITK